MPTKIISKITALTLNENCQKSTADWDFTIFELYVLKRKSFLQNSLSRPTLIVRKVHRESHKCLQWEFRWKKVLSRESLHPKLHITPILMMFRWTSILKNIFQNRSKLIFSSMYRYRNVIRHKRGHPSSHLIRSLKDRVLLGNVSKFYVVVFSCSKVMTMFHFSRAVRVTTQF